MAKNNILHELNDKYSYPEIAYRIEARTGRKYHPGHLRSVAAGQSKLSNNLLSFLRMAFPELTGDKDANQP